MLVPKLKKKKNRNEKGRSRILISVKVVGSAGSIRFIVNEDDVVADVVARALKIYAREERLPVLGSDSKDFLLFCPAANSASLDPWETIGRCGARNFMLCKKPKCADEAAKIAVPVKVTGKGTEALKAWINKSFKVAIPAR